MLLFQPFVALAQLQFGRLQAFLGGRQLRRGDLERLLQVLLALRHPGLAQLQLFRVGGKPFAFLRKRCQAVAIGLGLFGPSLGQGGFPEMGRRLGDGVRDGGRGGERAGILDARAQRAEPGFQMRADGIGRAAPDLLAHTFDRGPGALEQQGVGGAPDVCFGNSGGHGRTPSIFSYLSDNYPR
ncbi:hypothetical protein D9M68_692350 [compost metagenome]